MAFSQSVADFYRSQGMEVAPDWLLGALFGVGGMLGIYLGARTQRYVPAKWLKGMLAVVLTAAALNCLWGYLTLRR